MKKNIGIDIGGSHIAIGIVDENGVILEKIEKNFTEIEKENLKEVIEKYLIIEIEKILKNNQIEKVGISIPGTVTPTKIIKAVNLEIENYNLGEILSKKLGIKVVLRNDAKNAALAEVKCGSLKKINRAIFLTLGTGVGGAIILNGKLLDTGDLPGCEIGHMVIQTGGIYCNCGQNGCFEKYASMRKFKDSLKKVIISKDVVDSKKIHNVLVEELEKNIKDRDERIERIINDYIRYLATGVSNLINIFEPEAIGIGGSFTYFEDVLLQRLIDEIQKNKMLFNKREKLDIRMAELKNDAGIIGSVL